MTEDQFTVIAGLLLEIRDALVAPEVVVDDGRCLHPEEARVSLATPQAPDTWICHLCRHEHHGVIHN